MGFSGSESDDPRVDEIRAELDAAAELDDTKFIYHRNCRCGKDYFVTARTQQLIAHDSPLAMCGDCAEKMWHRGRKSHQRMLRDEKDVT